jgi:hypothetical protein
MLKKSNIHSVQSPLVIPSQSRFPSSVMPDTEGLRGCFKSVWRLKPRLQAPSPPARTQGKSGIRGTGIGRFCICSRDFSRQGYTAVDFPNILLD